VRIFYCYVLYVALRQIPRWARWINDSPLDLLWPVAWLEHVPQSHGIRFILWFELIAALAVAFFPSVRVFRVAIFFALLERVAFVNSEGKIGHDEHLLVLLSLIFVFLRTSAFTLLAARRESMVSLLIVRGAAQAMILLAYSMSGLGKLAGAFLQLLHGEPNIFLPSGLTRQIAERLLETNSVSILGPWFIEHPWVGWPGYLATVYVETFALVALFRPRLRAPFAAWLMLFHLFSVFTLTITFPNNFFLLAIFFLVTGMPRSFPEWHDFLIQLPLLGYPAFALLGRPKCVPNTD
jgi:hypothetical protein